MSSNTRAVERQRRNCSIPCAETTRRSRLRSPAVVLFLVFLFGGLTFCLDVRAEQCAPEVTENRRATLVHNDEMGVWFHAEVARCLLRDVAELPPIRDRVSLLEDRLELRDGQIETLRRANELADEAIDRATTEIDRALNARRLAEERLGAWWRSPVLWFAVGVIATGALTALSAYALSRLD